MKQNLSIVAILAGMAISGSALGQTYLSTGAVSNVANGACPGSGGYANSVINIADTGIIASVSDVFIDMNLTTFCSATMGIVLVAPNGDSCIILNKPFRSGPCSGNCFEFSGSNTLSFNSTYTATIPAAQPVPSGNYAPTGSAYLPQVGDLSTFLLGRSINGDWTLAVNGDASESNTIDSWSITFGAGALPLDLLDFSGSAFTGYNELKWATANETNTASFDIQRSVDGTNFQTIGNIAAIGSGNNNYHFSDKTYSPGANLYKLKMMDIDGQYSYSRTVKVLGTERGAGVKLSPNPVRDALNIAMNDDALLNTEGKIINSLGQTVFTFKIGQMNVKQDIKHLPAGIYLLSLSDGSNYRFVKEI